MGQVTALRGHVASLEIVHDIHRKMEMISAASASVMVLGWACMIQGGPVIGNVAQGDSQASWLAGLSRMAGDFLAINLGPVLKAVQDTFGFTAIGVLFSS